MSEATLSARFSEIAIFIGIRISKVSIDQSPSDLQNEAGAASVSWHSGINPCHGNFAISFASEA